MADLAASLKSIGGGGSRRASQALGSSSANAESAHLNGGGDKSQGALMQQAPENLYPATEAGLSIVNDFNSDTSNFKNLDFVEKLYTAFLIPYTKEQVTSAAFLQQSNIGSAAGGTGGGSAGATWSGASTTSTWNLMRVLDQIENPFVSTGSDGMVNYDHYRHVRQGLAAALGVLIDDGEYHTNNLGFVDTFLEALSVAASLSWTTLQLQQFLCLMQQTHSDITWMSNEKDNEMELKTVVGQNLTKRLARLCAKQEVPGFEKTIVEETVTEEITDPQAIAALEQKQKETKGKQKQTMAEMIAALPKIKVTNVVSKESVEEKLVTIDPYFSTSDATEIVSFIRCTLLQHWRLYKYAATVPRKVDTREYHLFVEDIPKQLDSLADAVTQENFEHKVERENFWDSMIAVIEEDFNKLFVVEVDQIYNLFVDEDSTAREKDGQERDEDESNAMSAEEYKRSIQVLKHRLEKKQQPATTASGEGDSVAAPATDANNNNAAVAAAAVDPLDDIEERIKKLETAIAARDAAPGKGGKK